LWLSEKNLTGKPVTAERTLLSVACSPPGERDLTAADRNFLEPRKIINGTKPKNHKLKPMFSPCGLNCTPVTNSWQNFLIFSLLDLHLEKPDLP